MKIFYNKKTKLYAGHKFIEKKFIEGEWKQEFSNDKYGFIEIEKSDWVKFLNDNKSGDIDIFIKNKKLLAVEKKIEVSFENLKQNTLNKRSYYLGQTAIEWGGAWEDCPQEILDKRKKARDEKKLIEKITEIEDLKKFYDF